MRPSFFYSFLFIGILSTSTVYSQNKYDEVVYLKNGTIIRGLIIEFIPDQSIKIKSKDGNIMHYRIDEIEKVTREPYNIERITINNKQIKQSGFINSTGLTIGILTDNEDFTFGIQNISSYLFTPYFSMGIGVGYETYEKFNLVPVFIDVHAYFSNSIVAPYFSMGIGKSLGTDEIKGGTLLNPALGVKAHFTAKTACDFSIGYKIQGFDQRYQGYTYSYSREYVTVKLGVTF